MSSIHEFLRKQDNYYIDATKKALKISIEEIRTRSLVLQKLFYSALEKAQAEPNFNKWRFQFEIANQLMCLDDFDIIKFELDRIQTLVASSAHFDHHGASPVLFRVFDKHIIENYLMAVECLAPIRPLYDIVLKTDGQSLIMHQLY